MIEESDIGNAITSLPAYLVEADRAGGVVYLPCKHYNAACLAAMILTRINVPVRGVIPLMLGEPIDRKEWLPNGYE